MSYLLDAYIKIIHINIDYKLLLCGFGRVSNVYRFNRYFKAQKLIIEMTL